MFFVSSFLSPQKSVVFTLTECIYIYIVVKLLYCSLLLCYYIVICCLILYKTLQKPYISMENNYMRVLQLKRLKMKKYFSLSDKTSFFKIYLHFFV